MTNVWTTPTDAVATLRSRWRRGVYLGRYAAGDAWQPLRLRVRGPSADDVLRDRDAVQRWAAAFTGVEPFVVEHRPIRSRTLGRNDVPARLSVETFDDLVGLLEVEREVVMLDEVLAATETRFPALTAWVASHSMRAVDHAAVWGQLLDVVEWIEANDGPRFIRHIDVPGIDTKFVETNERILRDLLLLVLDPERVASSERTFARRFGFADKPFFTRLRLLNSSAPFPKGITEIQLRTDELAGLELPVTTVFVVENETSYLTFPLVENAIVIFGGGFAVTTLEQIPWLAHRHLVYWGDIDTHGFAILDRLRERFPLTESMLMDRVTLLTHTAFLSVEARPTTRILSHLRHDEQELYERLVDGTFGTGARLEQERVRFSLVSKAVTELTSSDDRPKP